MTEKRTSHITQICDKEGIMIKAYKGFDKNMQCRGFQFEEGKSYEEPEAILCRKGFHACENPIDVLRYYAPGESIFRKVELEDVSEMREKDSKVCGKKIKIGEEISLRDMIRESVKIDIQTANESTSGYSSPAATSGGSSPAATSGKFSPAATSGKESIAAAVGRDSKAKSTIGNWIVLAEYGEWNGKYCPVLCVKCGKIDGKTLKPDVWYRLNGGEFEEVMEV